MWCGLRAPSGRPGLAELLLVLPASLPHSGQVLHPWAGSAGKLIGIFISFNFEKKISCFDPAFNHPYFSLRRRLLSSFTTKHWRRTSVISPYWSFQHQLLQGLNSFTLGLLSLGGTLQRAVIKLLFRSACPGRAGWLLRSKTPPCKNCSHCAFAQKSCQALSGKRLLFT